MVQQLTSDREEIAADVSVVTSRSTTTTPAEDPHHLDLYRAQTEALQYALSSDDDDDDDDDDDIIVGDDVADDKHSDKSTRMMMLSEKKKDNHAGSNNTMKSKAPRTKIDVVSAEEYYDGDDHGEVGFGTTTMITAKLDDEKNNHSFLSSRSEKLKPPVATIDDEVNNKEKHNDERMPNGTMKLEENANNNNNNNNNASNAIQADDDDESNELPQLGRAPRLGAPGAIRIVNNNTIMSHDVQHRYNEGSGPLLIEATLVVEDDAGYDEELGTNANASSDDVLVQNNNRTAMTSSTADDSMAHEYYNDDATATVTMAGPPTVKAERVGWCFEPRRVVLMLILAALLITASILVVYVMVTSRSSSSPSTPAMTTASPSSSPDPTRSPTPVPTLPPTIPVIQYDDAVRLIQDRIPNSIFQEYNETLYESNDIASTTWFLPPQDRALIWMMNEDIYGREELWLNNHTERWLQRFAMTVFFYALLDDPQLNWVVPTTDTCVWSSAHFFTINCQNPNATGLMTSLTVRPGFLSKPSGGTIPVELGLLGAELQDFRTDLPTIVKGSTIPTELGLWTKLTRLTIFNSDRLSGPIPSELGELTALTRLDLHRNDLTGTVPPGLLQRMTGLNELRLYSNRLTGDPWADLVEKSPPSLFNLEMDDNLFVNSTLPSSIGQLTSLTKLGLSRSGLRGTIPSEIGLLAMNIRRIKLEENSLTGSIPSEMGLLTQLTDVKLSANQLSGSFPKEVVNLLLPNGKLEDLEVFDNVNLFGTISASICSGDLDLDIRVDCGSSWECDCCKNDRRQLCSSI